MGKNQPLSERLTPFTIKGGNKRTRTGEPLPGTKQFWRNQFSTSADFLFLLFFKEFHRGRNCDIISFRSDMGTDGRTDGRTDGQTNGPTDQPMDQPTNTVSYRGATLRLKTKAESKGESKGEIK
jgi:hypothetical protein